VTLVCGSSCWRGSSGVALICVGSVRAAPGATTLGVLIGAAWPSTRPVVFVEADPDGGVVAARFGIGRDPGLASLAAALRSGPASAEVVWDCAQRLPGGLAVVPAHESAEVVSASLGHFASRLASWCSAIEDVDLVIDCGRVRPGSPTEPLVEVADGVLIVARPRTDELYAALPRARALAGSARVAGLVLVGDRPYGRDEVAAQLAVPVLGVVAEDRRGADVLWNGGRDRALRSSPLARTARVLAGEVAAALGVASAPAAEDSPSRRRRVGTALGIGLRRKDRDDSTAASDDGESLDAYMRSLGGRSR
jgi:hypothetical protein